MSAGNLGGWTLALALPLAVLGLYAVFLRPKAAQAAPASGSLDSRQARDPGFEPAAFSPAPGELPSSSGVADAAGAAAGDMQRSSTARTAELLARWSQRSSRSAALDALTATLRSRTIAIEACEPARAAHPALSVPLRELSHDLRELGGEPPVLWRLDLRGSYFNLLAALREIETARYFVLPVGLELVLATGFDDFSMQLWIWI